LAIATEIPESPVVQRSERGAVVLRTVGLSKRFGRITAVDGLDLDMRAGEVFGFLGPNGSGKSTTVGMILGLIEPTAGRVELFGRELPAARHDLRRRVGAIIETPAFWPYLSGRDNLLALARAAGGVPEQRVDALLAQVGLADRATSKFKTYSLGMKQRLGIASTLLTDPELVILDEPTNGLDPAGQREIRDLIPMLAREGRGVILASHLLHEVEQVCDRVAIIRSGKLLQVGTVAELIHGAGRDGAGLELTFDSAVELDRAVDILREAPFVERVTAGDGRLLVGVADGRGAEVNRALAERGLYAATIVPKTSTLEDVFLDLTEAERVTADVEGGAESGGWTVSRG
jgi:ABC-2 type transport system ATP-binding protein